jgi:hypothetical protein
MTEIEGARERLARKLAPLIEEVKRHETWGQVLQSRIGDSLLRAQLAADGRVVATEILSDLAHRVAV